MFCMGKGPKAASHLGLPPSHSNSVELDRSYIVNSRSAVFGPWEDPPELTGPTKEPDSSDHGSAWPLFFCCKRAEGPGTLQTWTWDLLRCLQTCLHGTSKHLNGFLEHASLSVTAGLGTEIRGTGRN